MRGSMRLSLQLKDPLDLVKFVGEMARRGFWTSKVVPTESGFEVFSPEPGLVGAKVVDDEISYKVYSSGDATSVELFGDLDKPFLKVSELVSLMHVGGCGEECVQAASLSASLTVEGVCSFGEVEVEGLGRLALSGLVAKGEGEAVSLAPLNEKSHLMTYTVRGSWELVKSRALSLHSLLPELVEVVRAWTCRQ